MAVDVTEGRLIRLAAVPTVVKWLPAAKDGDALTGETVRRWAAYGLKAKDGRLVKLEAIACGNGLATNEAALLRFFEALQQPAEAKRTPSAARRSHQRACAVLDAAGI